MIKLSERKSNTRIFKYNGVRHIVTELKEDIKGFTGCCFINSNLSPRKKRLILHRLIKEKYLTRG